jgi:hypothetical protein
MKTTKLFGVAIAALLASAMTANAQSEKSMQEAEKACRENKYEKQSFFEKATEKAFKSNGQLKDKIRERDCKNERDKAVEKNREREWGKEQLREKMKRDYGHSKS